MDESRSGRTDDGPGELDLPQDISLGGGASRNPLRWVLYAWGGAAFGMVCLSWFMRGPGDPDGIRVGSIIGALIGMMIGGAYRPEWTEAGWRLCHRTYS